MATEIAIVSLIEDATIEDKESHSGTIWQESLATVANQTGFQKLYWGRHVENPSIVSILVGELQSIALLRVPHPHIAALRIAQVDPD